MALLDAILKKVKSNGSIRKKLPSPPPELDTDFMKPKKKKKVHKYAHVKSRVDTSAPRLDSVYVFRFLPQWSLLVPRFYTENMLMATKIRRQQLLRGKVDSRWRELQPRKIQYEVNRIRFLERVATENKNLYKRITDTKARVVTTAGLHRDWQRNRHTILWKAQAKFVLFPPVPEEDIEDKAFAPPPGVKRPKVFLKVKVRGAANIGELCVELFTDVCPLTCELFLDLVRGDGLGYGYVGTCFFRKVPNLYWSGGDVVYNNGFGCYAQRGRLKPIGSENYHFPHSMPGLVSMRMTRDDEMCGSFHITFKPLAQFDLQSVVFGRVIRPCNTYNSIRSFGNPLSSHPVVEIASTRYRENNRWRYGRPNSRILKL